MIFILFVELLHRLMVNDEDENEIVIVIEGMVMMIKQY
jgi:hypothetical protein